MSENNLNFQSYLTKTEEIFSSSSISFDQIKSFLIQEKQHRGFLNKEYQENYIRIFTLIRDRVILPNAGKLDLAGLFEDLSIMFRYSGIALQPHPNITPAVASILNSMEQNDYYWKSKLLRIALVLQTFNNNDWRETFVQKLFDIPSAACFKSMQDAQAIAVLFRSIFKSCTELLECADKVVFAEEFWQKDMLTQKSNYMWILEVNWNLVFKESPEHMVIMPKWFSMFEKALKVADRELVFYMHMPLSHIYLNMCHTQEEFKVFNDKVEMPLSKYIQKNMRRWGFKPTKKKLPENNGRRIAFVFDRLVANSPMKLLVSLLTYLKDEEDLELYFYDMGYVEKAISDPAMVQEVKNLGVKYINNHDLIDDNNRGHHYSHFNKAVKLREQAVKDDIDILIMSGNRMPSGFMFATRSAPLQIFWNHGNHEYDVKNIDKRIRHFDDGYRTVHEFERFQLRMLDKYLKLEEEENKRKAEEVKKKLPPHEIVFGSIGRLMKISDEYLDAVAKILKIHPEAIYLACGSGNFEELRAKVINLGITDRFIITGWIDPHIYGYVIDIYLNTFPLVGGESVNEFLAKGENKHVVSYRKSIK